MKESNYYIEAWVWNESRKEYVPNTVFENDDFNEVMQVFDNIQVDADVPQVTLWECGEDDDIQISIKEAYEEGR